MAGRMSMERAKLILTFVVWYHKLERRNCSLTQWVGLRLSCGESAAGSVIDKAQKMIGVATWNTAVEAAQRRDGPAADAITAAAAGEHNPAAAGEANPAADYNAAAEAERVIRDFLNSQVEQHQRQLKDALMGNSRPRSRHSFLVGQRVEAYSAAMIKLAGSLLDHLDAEAKQARADDAEDQAEIERGNLG